MKFSEMKFWWWVAFPAPSAVRTFANYLMEVDELCLQIAAITGADVNTVQDHVRSVAKESLLDVRSAARKVANEAMFGESSLMS